MFLDALGGRAAQFRSPPKPAIRPPPMEQATAWRDSHVIGEAFTHPPENEDPMQIPTRSIAAAPLQFVPGVRARSTANPGVHQCSTCPQRALCVTGGYNDAE